MASEERIVQIIPAQGWYAMFRGEGEEEDLKPIACFALFESREDGETLHMVRPMAWGDGVMEFCDQGDGFAGIVYTEPGQG